MFLFQVRLFVPPSEDTDFALHTHSTSQLGGFAVSLKSQPLQSASSIGRSRRSPLLLVQLEISLLAYTSDAEIISVAPSWPSAQGDVVQSL